MIKAGYLVRRKTSKTEHLPKVKEGAKNQYGRRSHRDKNSENLANLKRERAALVTEAAKLLEIGSNLRSGQRRKRET